MFTQMEAARRLGVDVKTLRKRMARHDLTYEQDPLDGRRRRLVSVDAIEQLVALYRGGAQAHEDQRLVWDALWEAVQGLERRLAALEAQQIARPLIARREPAVSRERLLAPAEPLTRPRPGERPGDTFPAGWVAFSTFCREHGVNARSMERLIVSGRAPALEYGEWVHGGQYHIRSAWRADQLAAVARVMAAQWPGRFTPCARCPHGASDEEEGDGEEEREEEGEVSALPAALEVQDQE